VNPISFVQCSSTIVLSIAPVLLVAACAGHPVPSAEAPTPVAVALAPSAPQTRAEPTGGTIAISDEIRKACGISKEDAFFAFDSAALASTDVGPLDLVARCFSSGPLAGRALHLIGHADPRGPSEYNMALGQRRADSVQGYIDQHGVKSTQVVSTSRGAMDATGQDEAGWTHDRRVDVTLGV